MAGYFNPESLDDAEMSELSDHSLWLWITLCIQPNPRCGIFKPNKRLLSLRSRCPMEKVDDAFDEFEELGWIKQDKDSGHIWIVNYIKHQGKNAMWKLAAAREFEALKKATGLAEEAASYYSDIDTEIASIHERVSASKSDTKSVPKSDTNIAPKSVSPETEQNRTETEQEEVTTPPSMPATSGDGDDRVKQMLPLVDHIRGKIVKYREDRRMTVPPAADRMKCAEKLEQCIRLDGMKAREMREAIDWMFDTDNFWAKQVGSVASLRNKTKSGLTKMQEIHDDWVEGRQRGSPRPSRQVDTDWSDVKGI